MRKEKVVIIGEVIGEFIIGIAVGKVLIHVIPGLSKAGKVMLWTGTALGAWTVGRCFGRELFDISNKYFGTDIEML